MPGQGGIQLLPETRKSIEVKVPGENRWVNVGLGCFTAVAVIYAGLYMYVRSLEGQVQASDARLETLEKKRVQDQAKYDELLVFSKQTEQIGKILRDHVFWSKALSRVESHIQPEVQMKLFTASAPKQNAFFNAYAPNYAVIAKQIAAFTNDEAVADVNLGNVKVDNSGRIEFALTVIFDPEKFLKRSDDEF